MLRFICLTATLVFLGASAVAQVYTPLQDCSLKYLGRNADQSIPGDPGALEGVVKQGLQGYSFSGRRVSGDNFISQNVWYFFLPTPLDPTSELDKRSPAIDLFQITCDSP